MYNCYRCDNRALFQQLTQLNLSKLFFPNRANFTFKDKYKLALTTKQSFLISIIDLAF